MPTVDQSRRHAMHRFLQEARHVLSISEQQILYKILKDYKRQKRVDRLVRGLKFILRSSPERHNLIRYVRNIIPQHHVTEFDTLMSQHSNSSHHSSRPAKRVHLGVGSLGRHSPTCSNDQLFDSHEEGTETTVVTIHRDHDDNSLGFCIRGGSEHGLGIYVSELERGSVADLAGLEVGDKILEVNNISLKNVASSSAVNVLTGSNHLKLVVERSGKIPEWRFSKEKTSWYDSRNKKLISGDFEENGTAHFIRGLDVEIPERRVTLSSTKNNKVLGFNIRGGSEYGLGIYISSIDHGGIAEANGIRVGDQVIDVNGIPFDNITHVHAVEIIKDQTHLILTLRDVGRYPAYKELYAEYTWSSGKRRNRSHVDRLGNKFQETKLTDMWIEREDHFRHPGLHLKVPVEVLSNVTHSHSDIYDSVNQPDEGHLQTEIYLPDMENEDRNENFQKSENKDDPMDDLDSVNLDMWAKSGGGHDNPAFIHESVQSLAGSESESGLSDTDDESGIHGEYSLTMDDIIARADNVDASNARGDNSKLNVSDFIVKDNSDVSHSDKKHIDEAVLILRPNRADSDSTERDSEIRQSTSVALNNDLDPVNDDAVHILRPNKSETGSEHDTEDKIEISKAMSLNQSLNQDSSRFSETIPKTFESEIIQVHKEVTKESESYYSSKNSTPNRAELIVRENGVASVSYPMSSAADIPSTSSDSRRRSVEFLGLADSDSDNDDNEAFMLQSFTDRIKDLESRQANIGMMELKTLSPEKSSSKNKGSLKRTKWKSIKDKFMGSLRMKLAKREPVRKDDDNHGSIGKKRGVFESTFSPQMVHHNMVDNHSMATLGDAAQKLLDADETNAVMKHLHTYHESRDLDRFVEVLLVLLDKPEKILLLRDIRNTIYPVHMNRFDDMVNSHEVEAYEILSTKLHEQLRQDKIRKPKKHLLTTEVDLDPEEPFISPEQECLDLLDSVNAEDDHGHFHIKSMDSRNHGDEDNTNNIIIEEKSINSNELVLNPSVLLLNGRKDVVESVKGSEGSSLTSAESMSRRGVIIAYVSKIKPTLGLCVSGGSDSKRQPVVKVDQVITGGAAADEPRIQPGLIIVSVDEHKLLGASHTDAVAALKKSFSNKRRVTMRVVLKKEEITDEEC